MSAQPAPNPHLEHALAATRRAILPATELASDHARQILDLRIKLGLERIKDIQQQLGWLGGVLESHQRDAIRGQLRTPDGDLISAARTTIDCLKGEAQRAGVEVRGGKTAEHADQIEAVAAKLLEDLHDVRRKLGA